MANVPTVDAPTVGQSSGALNVSAPAAAFGASDIAEGLGKIGASAEQASDMLKQHAEQFQAVNNKAESDQAYVTHLQTVNQFAADYQANNRGMAAINNLPSAYKTIEKQRTDIGDTLTNPMARAMFDADSRRATASVTGELTRFASTQRTQYVLKQSLAVQEATASDSVIHPQNFDSNMAQAMQQQAFINQQLGLSPEEGSLEARKLYGNTVSMITKSLAGNGDPTGASAFLEAHKEGMDGKIYADTLYQLKPALMANDAADIGHEAVTDALHGMGSAVGPTVDFLSNVHGREGTAANPRSTATGTGQFIEKTWLGTLKNDPSFASDIAGKSDKEILAMRQDPAIANRAILSYAQTNATGLQAAGLPVNAATVGMAHGYGLGGAEALLKADPNVKVSTVLPASVIKANPEIANQTVAQVTAGFTSRFGTGSVDSSTGGTPTASQLAARQSAVLALVDQKVQAKYGDNAVVRDQVEAKALSELNRQVGAARQTESDAYTTLGNFAMNNQIQDLPTLLKTVPNGLQMYNSLPLSQSQALKNDLHKNATEVTPERFANMQALNGMYAVRSTNPQAFLNAPIATMDLPQAQKLQFLKQQSDLRGKPAAQDPNAKLVNQVIHSEQYKSLIGPDALDIKKNSEDEFHLIGTFQAELDNWNAQNPGKAPGPKDVNNMLARSAQEHKSSWTVFGMNTGIDAGSTHTFDVSDEDKAGATKSLIDQGKPVTPLTIAQEVRRVSLKNGAK